MKKINSLLNDPRIILTITFILSIFPILVILLKDFSGGVALWNDPARDLIAALDNRQKPTLIGPSAGIPGVFYGPYWIWLLSFAQLFSKQPGTIIFIVQTIPYLIIFPFVLSRFSKIFNLQTLALLWLLFLYTFSNYFTDLWNPHPAPLLILFAIYLQYIRENKFSTKNLFYTLLSGLAVGVTMNFQLSFGIGMAVGSILYLLGERIRYIVKHKNKTQGIMQSLITALSFFLGTIIAFTPFFLFELRHQFQQTKILLNAFTHYGGGLVTQTGLTKPQILQSFFGRIPDLLHLPFLLAICIFTVASVYYSYEILRPAKPKKKIIATQKHQNLAEIKLIVITFCISFSVLYIYLTAKNPVWSYHFIGVEIPFLLLFGIILNRSRYLRLALLLWFVVLASIVISNFFHSLQSNPKTIYGNAVSEEQTIDKIQKESHSQNYTVFAYESGIYPYEYSYLFRAIYHKNVPYRPELNPIDSSLVFLIFPPNTKLSLKQDFINFRTTPVKYTTVGEWTELDGTQIIKRIKSN